MSMRSIIASLPVVLYYEQVHAHKDGSRGVENLDDMEKLNVIADEWADKQLHLFGMPESNYRAVYAMNEDKAWQWNSFVKGG
eukprot:scaffold3759_cov61-Cyclotella_meneghiniana.AAC.5